MTILAPLLEEALRASPQGLHFVSNRSSGLDQVRKSVLCRDPEGFLGSSEGGKPDTISYEPDLYELRRGPSRAMRTKDVLGFIGCFRFFSECATTRELLSFSIEHNERVFDLLRRGFRIVALGRDEFLGVNYSPSDSVYMYAAVLRHDREGKRVIRRVKIYNREMWNEKHIFLVRAKADPR